MSSNKRFLTSAVRNERKDSPLVIIVGPTGVGKTFVSLEVAPFFNGEIISADSRLFYRGMDIGTAKPSLVEREKIPHHLIDISEPDETWNLARFQAAAKREIKSIQGRGHLPFLVGGTGQYIHALIQGWSPPKVKPDLEYRRQLENNATEMGFLWLYDQLKNLDPEAAERMDPRNVRRTIRALEVIQATGRKFSDQKKVKGNPCRTLIVGLFLDRDVLYNRIDSRINTMLENGLPQEVSQLVATGFSSDLPSMSAIGYKECAEYLSGKITMEEVELIMKRRTRAYVRRQANWFKMTDPQIKWFNAEDRYLVEKIKKEITNFLE
jgi:tRNA dimethylallyltransferase